MLKHLFIKNYALIAEASLSFGKGLTIITGETGAGKSILLDALGLVLGKRADKSALRNEQQKCVIEAQFDLDEVAFSSYFQEQDLDFEPQTIIRREILPSGKSRIFVNDSPTTLQLVTHLGKKLIDIHSQYQTQDLFQETYHIQILDALAKNNTILTKYQENLAFFKQIQTQKTDLLEQKMRSEKEQDYHQFLLQELVEAQLIAGSQETLEAQLQSLSNVEAVEEALQKSAVRFTDDQFGVLNALKEIKTSLQKISGYAGSYGQIYERVESAEIELKDIADELDVLAQQLEQDPEQLERVSQQLQLIYQLQKKHQVTTVEELLALQSDLEAQLFQFEGLEEQLEQLEKELQAVTVILQETARELHEKRSEVIPVLVHSLQQMVAPLGMPNARFEYQLRQHDEFYSHGSDTLEVLFSANKGMPFTALKKAASGGEMSRIMLSVKAILAQYAQLPTIVFDEIDTGVSGDVADKMGDIMKQMSAHMQVFAITHLPQVAAKGDVHFSVVKDQSLEVTETAIQALSPEQRIQEVAQMLSGHEVTTAALAHAKNLLGQ